MGDKREWWGLGWPGEDMLCPKVQAHSRQYGIPCRILDQCK